MAHQDNDITGLELTQSTSSEMCEVKVFLLNRVSVISAVISAAVIDHWNYI